MRTRSTRTRRRPAVPEDTRQHARTIAEAVDAAWHSHHGGSDIHIPISVVAALALVAKGPGDADPAGRALLLDADGFAGLLRDIWLRFTVARPDLNPRTQPLWRWLLEEDPDAAVLRAAHAAGRAALWHGQMELTGIPERRQEVDLLASVLQVMRARSARAGLGQFLTPLDVTRLVGQVLAVGEERLAADLAGAETATEGTSVCDPCAGTGTMLLGAAIAMRERGVDPASCVWYANDLDWLAAACLAVNTHLWGLGGRVLVGCGDGLTDWVSEALRQRGRAIEEMASVYNTARLIRGVRALLYDPEWEPVAHLPDGADDGVGSIDASEDRLVVVDEPAPAAGMVPAGAVGLVAGDLAPAASESELSLAVRLGMVPAPRSSRSSQLRLF